MTPSVVYFDPHTWLKSRGFDARNLTEAVQSARSPEVTSTPFYEACCEGNLEMCRYILAYLGGTSGSNVASTCSLPSSTGMTPFAAACGLGHLHVVKWLFDEAGARADARTRTARGTTPLMVAAGYWGHLKVADWLVEEAGAEDDVRAENNAGQTPLDVACRDERVHVAVWLLLRGAANDAPAPQAPPSSVETRTAASGAEPHVTVASLRLALRRAQPLSEFRTALGSALAALLDDHSNFTRLVLPAVSIQSHVHLASATVTVSRPSSKKTATSLSPTSKRSKHGLSDAAGQPVPSSCLATLRGLESTVLVLVADFVGVVRGRRLRNLREVATNLAVLQAEDEAEEAAARRRSVVKGTCSAGNGLGKKAQEMAAQSVDAAIAISDPKARGRL